MPPSYEIEWYTTQLNELLRGPSGPVAAFLGRVGARVETAAKLALTDYNAVDQGRLRGSITHVVERYGDDLAVYVGTNVRYGIFVHEGRNPGSRMPPVDVIEEWARRKHIITDADTDAEAHGKAFVIARAISRRGIPPKRYLSESIHVAGTVI